MTAVAGSAREKTLSWQDIPVDVRSTLAFELGAGVVKVLRQNAGVVGGIAARLLLDDGRWVFLRAVPARHPLAGNLRAEADVTSLLPAAAPVPRVLCRVQRSWLAVVFSDIDGARPNLRPGSPDISAVLTALGRAARTLRPCPVPRAPDAIADLGHLLSAWRVLAADAPQDLDPWLLENLDSLLALEGGWHPWATGDTLLHNDIRPDNMVRIGPGRVLITGWRYPARGAAWLDLAALVPQLVLAGHEVAGAEKLVLSRQELKQVPAWAVTGYAAALCGHWQLAARLDEPSGSSGLRADQRRAAAAATQWLRHRTRWEPRA